MKITQNKSNVFEPAKPNTTDWKSINWNKVNRFVTSLQERIYLASRKGDKKKVRDLQRQLMRSYYAKLKAVRRVTQENKGKYTPGIDGFRATSNRARGKLVDILKGENMKFHRPKPALRKYIPKKNGKLRSLGIPTIKDRVYQEIIRMALEPEWEAKFEATSNGFRPSRRQHDAIARNYFNVKSGYWCWIFEGDFKSCFDTLSHEFILKQIKGFPQYNLVKRFLEAGYVDNGVFHESVEGTPQGGLLSPLLANIALHGMEEALGITYKEQCNNDNVTYVTRGKYRLSRYADDFLIFAKTKKDIDKVPELLQPYLNERGLILAEDKTDITHLSKGFDFLGMNFKRDGDGITRVRPSKDSLKKFKDEVDYICESTRGENVGTLINRLNPLIRGTANYWRFAVSNMEEMVDMDSYVWTKTFNFLKRLHSNKGNRWIKKRYYPSYDDGKHHDNWVLTDPKSGNTLKKMIWYKPTRYIMVKYNYSPYDKDKKEYFESRKTKFALFC